MTIFDILRYGNTDIRNLDELLSLPEGLIDWYWIEANRWYVEVHSKEKFFSEDFDCFSHRYKCRNLTNWKPTGNVTEYDIFQIALRKFANELV